MTDLFQFASENPWLAFFLALIVSSTIVAPFKIAFQAYNRKLRSMNIAAHGWPPAHLDADGDFKSDN